MQQAEDAVAKLVAQVREVEVPVGAFRTIFDAEIYEYHETMFLKTPELYDPRTLYRVRNCAGISASAYIRERHRLEEFRSAAEQVFEQVDVVITPTTPAAAPKLADLEALAIPDVRPFEVKYLLRNTAPFSSLYWPSTSVPCGFTSDGLPVGMQISSRPGSDLTTLRLAYAYEQATGWNEKRPEISD
jgi:aspartyl-tRNA(Asn)/glutamyl-tRNA(Gln) amidotransferase subunit A